MDQSEKLSIIAEACGELDKFFGEKIKSYEMDDAQGVEIEVDHHSSLRLSEIEKIVEVTKKFNFNECFLSADFNDDNNKQLVFQLTFKL